MKLVSPDFLHIKQLFQQHERQFLQFYDLLNVYNARYNLTAITQKEEVIHKHFYDSLAGEALFPQNAACVEIGSGAGFPSIPLKIVRNDLKMTLIESTGKKCAFLRAAIDALGLTGVEVLHARAEEVGRDARYREQMDVAFARAVAPLPTLAEYCLPLVRVGGRMIAYKGGTERAEEGARAFALLGARAEQTDYELPLGYGARSLIVASKTERTPQKYPRGNGKERTAPIV